MSSTKSCIGHLLGAAGAVEAIFSMLAIRDQVAPPTINLDNPSVETPIDLVPHQARKREIDVVLSNSFGFGGTNASLVLRRARLDGRSTAFAIIAARVGHIANGVRICYRKNALLTRSIPVNSALRR